VIKGAVFALTVVLTTEAAAAAAGQQPQTTPVMPVAPPELRQPADGRKVDIDRRRKHVQMLEGVLVAAVRSGAEEIAKQMQRGNPNIVMFTGQARARGFMLENYGVFFDVEIPALRESVVWSMRTLERDLNMATALEALRRAFAGLPQGPDRMQAEQALQRMQALNPAPQLPGPQHMAQPGAIVAANVPTIDDPHVAYTESVQNALIDAMLDFSLPMDLQDDEYLTVAARDSEGPLQPGVIDDASTIVIRVKGSDLAMYAADKSKRDEVRKRVVVRVF
jgi:hypothetical protein